MSRGRMLVGLTSPSRPAYRPEHFYQPCAEVDGAAVFRLNWPNVNAEGPLNPSTYLIVISFGTYSDYNLPFYLSTVFLIFLHRLQILLCFGP